MTDFYGQGHIGGRDVEFLAPYREANRTPVVLRATMTLPLSLEDITAALWAEVTEGLNPADLADEEIARQMVFESLLTMGIDAVAQAQEDIKAMTPDHADYQALTDLRSRVAVLFGAVVPPQRGTGRRPRQELAGASGGVR